MSKVITAQDITDHLNGYNPKIDLFINEVLILKFLEHGDSISIDTKQILTHPIFLGEFSIHRFTHQMRKRGFFIETKCEDRPCADPYVVIRLPSQGE